MQQFSAIMSSDYLPPLIFGAFVLSIFAYREWEFRIMPLRISKEEINSIVDELMKKYDSDAEQHACIEEDAAWRRSNVVEQGKWRRVRRELWSRRKDGK